MPDIASFIPDFLPFGKEDTPAPMSQNIPAGRKALANQLSDPQLNSILDSYDPAVRDAYKNLQLQRVNLQGNLPYSKPVIARGIAAAGRSKAITPEPEGNIVQNFISDVGNVASVVNPLKLIPGLIHEAALAGTLPNEVHKVTEANGPLEALGAIGRLPGVRLIPGAYNVGNLAPGGPGLLQGAQQHPLFAALDVLPYASKAAKFTPVVKAANESRLAQIGTALEHDIQPPRAAVPPIKTFVENFRPSEPGGFVVGEKPIGGLVNNITAPALEPNAIGRISQSIGEKARQSPLINNLFDTTLRPRGVAKIANDASAQITQERSNLLRTPTESTGLEIGKWLDKEADAHLADLTPEDKLAISNHLQSPSTTPLTPELQARADALATQSDVLRQAWVDDGRLKEVKQLGWEKHGPETYPAPVADLIASKHEAVANNIDNLRNAYTEFPNEAAAPYLDSLSTHLEARDWPAALGDMQLLEQTGKIPTVHYPSIKQSIQDAIKTERQHLPARWQPTLESAAQKAAQEGLAASKFVIKDGYTADQAATLAANQVYSWMDDNSSLVLRNEIAATLHDLLRSSPETPVYLPHVTPDEALRTLNAPSIFTKTGAPSALKERVFMGGSGSSRDPYLSLGYSARQAVQEGVQKRAAQTIIRNYGATLDQLTPQYLQSYGALLDEASGGLVDPQVLLRDKIAKEWQVFDPNSWLEPSLSKSSFNNLSGDTILIPKDVHRAIEGFKKQYQSDLGTSLNPLMKAFRTSVLTLSPRFYVNNVTGGGIMTYLNADNPLTIGQHIKDAWHLTKNPEAVTALRDGTALQRTSFTNMIPAETQLQGAAEWAMKLDPSNAKGLLGAYQQFEAGKALSRMWSKIEGGAVKFNAVNDQFWQTLNFLEGRKNALNKGLSDDMAIQMGVEHGRRFMETWDTLTPTERTIIKSIFPFYGFTRSLLKFALQYPTHHPTRLSILSNLAHAEEEDFGSGLPQRFASMFWLGPVDSHGTVQAINVGGMNPFQDVASYASLLGFFTGAGGDLSAVTRNANPLIGVGLRRLGVDTAAGTGDLYPDMTIDPVTGQMKAVVSGNPLIDLANSIVPQTSIITNLAGMNGQFKAMMDTNPQAAGKTLLAAAGIPTPLQQIDVPKERMKAEISRYTQSQKVLNEALKSGDWDEANNWASLRPFLESIRKKAESPEAVSKFLIGDSNGTALRALKASVTGNK